MSEQQPPANNPPGDSPGLAFLSMTTSQRFHAWRAKVGDEEAETQLLDFIVGGGALNSFCNDNGFSYTSVLRWIRKERERGDRYDAARSDRADFQAELIIEVARRDCSAPVVDKDGNLLGTVVDKGKVAQARNEMDALKWVAARMKPKTWGDKIEVDHDFNPREATDEQLAKALGRFGLGELATQLLQRKGEDGQPAERAVH
jgi:hypothetical protein